MMEILFSSFLRRRASLHKEQERSVLLETDTAKS